MTRTLCLVALLVAALPAAAQVVQLVRPGDTVLTLQAGSTRALVRETRPLQLPAGESAVSFAWIGDRVDASSVALSLTGGTVGEVSRAPGQDRTLVWQVTMPQAGPAKAVISYFLDGLKWQPTYVLTVDAAAGKALLESSLRLTNETGSPLRQVGVQIGAPGAVLVDAPPPADQPPAATLSVEPGATAVVALPAVADIPATLRYVYQPDRSATDVNQVLRLGLDKVGVDALALPDGPMLIQQAGDPPAPVFKTQLDFQPDKEFEVALGPEPDVVVERKLLSSKRSNFDFDRFGRMTGVDTTEDMMIAVRNHLAHAIALDVTETVLATWDLKGPEPAKKDASSVQWSVPLEANAAAELKFSLVKHAGTRGKK